MRGGTYILTSLLAVILWSLVALAVDPPQPLPDVVSGFVVTPLFVAAAPTALAFGPGDADGPDLYATTLLGDVVRISLIWTPVGPLATGSSTVTSGFTQPLGLIFDTDGNLYVSDSHPGTESGRVDGYISKVVNGTKSVIVDGLPNGRHNTNHLRFGPGGRLYFANGNPNDNGIDGGEKDVFPYSGAVLSVDASQVSTSPAILHWKDGTNPIPEDQIASDPLNADFASKVQVLAHGFRNIFGIAFSPAGVGYTAMNGPDDPAAQDALFRLTSGTDYRFPFCYNEGAPGATGTQITVANNPKFPVADCSAAEPATALLGWHTCTTGLDFPATGASAFPAEFQNSVYVSECAAFFPQDLAQRDLEALQSDDPVDVFHNTSHKVVRVALDPTTGNATDVSDFLTGLVLSTDVLFGPDGAMYVADVEGILRVAPAVPSASPSPPPLPTVTVAGVGAQFVPAVIAIPAGTTVQWQGLLLGHTVDTANSPQDALAGNANDPGNADANPDTFRLDLPMGTAVTHQFNNAGVFHYFCEPHHMLGMIGTVIVE